MINLLNLRHQRKTKLKRMRIKKKKLREKNHKMNMSIQTSVLLLKQK